MMIDQLDFFEIRNPNTVRRNVIPVLRSNSKMNASLTSLNNFSTEKFHEFSLWWFV